MFKYEILNCMKLVHLVELPYMTKDNRWSGCHANH
jgi:hypothetical protein